MNSSLQTCINTKKHYVVFWSTYAHIFSAVLQEVSDPTEEVTIDTEAAMTDTEAAMTDTEAAMTDSEVAMTDMVIEVRVKRGVWRTICIFVTTGDSCIHVQLLVVGSAVHL